MMTSKLRSCVGGPGSQGCRTGWRGLAPVLNKTVLLALLLGLALMLGCGTGGGESATGGSDSGTGSNSANSMAVLVNLGEFAAVPDQIVSFELTIRSVTLRSSGGDVGLLSTPRRVELSRFKAEPLLLAKVPQGDYRGVVIGVSNPEISFIDSSGVLHQNVLASLTSSTAANSSEFSIGSTPRAINLHPVFLGGSFGGGDVTMTPGLNFDTLTVAPTKDLVGRIATVAGSSFTLDVGNGTFILATDAGTELRGINALNELTAGMTVEVDAILAPDGTFRATKVELENREVSAVAVEGLTNSLAASRLEMMVREVHGPGVPLPGVGNVLTVDTNAGTQFRLATSFVDLNHLDFPPVFDALTIALGQNVRAAADSGSHTTITADQLKLEGQSFDGTAGGVSPGTVSGQFSFPLDLTPDSAFARLTGHTSVLVTLQPSTQRFLSLGLEDCVDCIAGGTVRVRGLLFFSGGQYRLVAEWLGVI